MGSNMQRQAVPLLRPEAPVVGTGFERTLARDSRTLVIAEGDGTVEYVSADKIIVKYNIDKNSEKALVSFDDSEIVEYILIKFLRTNQDTCITQKPIVKVGEKVKKGEEDEDTEADEQPKVPHSARQKEQCSNETTASKSKTGQDLSGHSRSFAPDRRCGKSGVAKQPGFVT